MTPEEERLQYTKDLAELESIFAEEVRQEKIEELKRNKIKRRRMRRDKNKVNDYRRFRLDDKAHIPMGGGRPVRDKPINNDDIINLAIALHGSRTIEEFLKRT